MEAIILAGGLGTRLFDELGDLPKPMVPINGRPFLEILLQHLKNFNFNHIIMSVGYRADRIIDYFGNNFLGMNISYSVEKTPLGTGGAIRLAMEQCAKNGFFVLNGDTYIEHDFLSLYHEWQQSRAPTIVSCSVSDTSRYGRLSIKNGMLLGFQEKGMSGPGVINSGCYIFEYSDLLQFKVGEKLSIEKDFFEVELGRRIVNVIPSDSLFIDIGIPSDLVKAREILYGK